ncbi:unnamed protein product, partial [Mesorhabditis spiculigera]
MSALGKFVGSQTVRELLQKGIINKEGVRLLDCSFVPGVKPDWKKFRLEQYGKFDKLAQAKTRGREMYLAGHIPEAVHADLDLAMYPGQYERFSQYPPEVFEQYIELLGVNRGEHLILYGRGAYHGMMWPARFAWLFKSYGHQEVSLLDGGLEDWANRGFEITQEVPKLPKGNWKAGDHFKETLITFEELESVNGNYEPKPVPDIEPTDPEAEQKEKEAKWSKEMEDWEKRNRGHMLIDQTSSINFLDSRPRAQFEGLQESGLNQMYCDAAHIPGFLNLPVGEMFTDEGTIKDPAMIKAWLEENGFSAGKPTVTQCMTGMQASLLAYGIEYALPDHRPRLHSGSLKEMEVRDPRKVSGGHRHIPLSANAKL